MDRFVRRFTYSITSTVVRKRQKETEADFMVSVRVRHEKNTRK